MTRSTPFSTSSTCSPFRRGTCRWRGSSCVGQLAGRKAETGLVWADVMGVAGTNARLVGRYLAFMVVAGVTGCYGIVDRNPMLIVGAMAVSPDLLPIAAIAVGVIGRDLTLARRALLMLVAGLASRGSSPLRSRCFRISSTSFRQASTSRTPSSVAWRT